MIRYNNCSSTYDIMHTKIQDINISEIILLYDMVAFLPRA